jgi:hypothetical protein
MDDGMKSDGVRWKRTDVNLLIAGLIRREPKNEETYICADIPESFAEKGGAGSEFISMILWCGWLLPDISREVIDLRVRL